MVEEVLSSLAAKEVTLSSLSWNNGAAITGGRITSTGTGPTITLTALSPGGIAAVTVSKWMILNILGTDYFVPLWT